jgi:hypothetical protein
VAVDRAGRIAVLYRGTDAAELWYVHGTLDASGRIIGRERLLDIGLDRR